jgi:plastocyanin
MKPLRDVLLASALILLPACEPEDRPEPAAPTVVTPPSLPSRGPASPTPAPPPPLALSCQAEPRSGDTPLTVRFTAFPSGGTGSYDFWWEFGDGATSTARRPAHTYLTPGVHPAALRVTSGDQVQHCQRPIRVGGVAILPRPGPSPTATTLPDLVITILGVNASLSYSPNPANARVGQRVIWRNTDAMTHTATSGSFDTGFLGPGASSAPLTMGAAGSFPYLCTIHPGMVGTLVVTP